MVLISYVPEFASTLYGIASGQKIIVVLIGFQSHFLSLYNIHHTVTLYTGN